MEYLISLFLVACSALFSGLTLGFFTLDPHTLQRRARTGDARAAAIYPIRVRGNQLLTTLLLGNVTVNTILSVYLGSIASGVLAALMATAAIFLFGEIIPQAVISRHALKVGATLAPLVRILMVVASPIAWPIAVMLDWFLGDELPTVYSHRELMEIIAEHEQSEHSAIDADEKRIVHGALQFSHTTVREVMTPNERVVCYEVNQRLTDTLLEDMNEHGYSRYPIYQGDRGNIVGLLYVKDLIIEEEGVSIGETEEAFDRTFLRVRAGEKLDAVLAKMLTQRSHLAMVMSKTDTFLGVISLEDIIEEIIQVEIEDEDDD
jgi:metal transporter CNNM